MLVMTVGGKERTVEEFGSLFTSEVIGAVRLRYRSSSCSSVGPACNLCVCVCDVSPVCWQLHSLGKIKCV
jgi:hypothetical protein